MEFALILPLLLFVLFAIIEFSIAMYDKAVITNASREGARMGIVSQNPRPDAATITATVNTYAATNLISFGPATPSTTVTGAPCAAPGGYITVSVAYTYNFFVLPNFMTSLTGPLVLNGAAVMRCE